MTALRSFLVWSGTVTFVLTSAICWYAFLTGQPSSTVLLLGTGNSIGLATVALGRTFPTTPAVPA